MICRFRQANGAVVAGCTWRTADHCVVESRRHPSRRLVAHIAIFHRRHVVRGQPACRDASGSGMATGAVARRAMKNAPHVTGLAFHVGVLTGQWETGGEMIEILCDCPLQRGRRRRRCGRRIHGHPCCDPDRQRARQPHGQFQYLLAHQRGPTVADRATCLNDVVLWQRAHCWPNAPSWGSSPAWQLTHAVEMCSEFADISR